MHSWQTKVTIPEHSRVEVYKAFLEMIYVVAKLAHVPKNAEWKSKVDGELYTITAEYTEEPYVPSGAMPKLRFVF